jgi:hypothetical protein
LTAEARSVPKSELLCTYVNENSPEFEKYLGSGFFGGRASAVLLAGWIVVD